MIHSRRDALALGLVSTAGLASSVGAVLPGAATGTPRAEPSRANGWRAGPDGQRRADLGNGQFLNPVLSGDRPDPNILKDGADYWATFSSFEYYPAVVVWHSQDLVNWTPVGPALTTPLGSVWALDIAKHDGRYFIYIPIFNANDPTFAAGPQIPCKIFVVHADSMRGPWSEPVDMDIRGYIDPGHAVGGDGKRYLFLNGGARVRISDDGLRRSARIEQVYDGWPIPEDWIIEAPALEGPKVLRRDGIYYLFSGQGGTAGPPTSHMVIVARARSIDGPWENHPRNPIVRTAGADEPWWSRGHATPVQGPSGDWWLAYHGYENGYRTLGRQMLLEPFIWDADGWPRTTGGDLSTRLPMPRGGHDAGAGMRLSGPFVADDLGRRLAFFAPPPGYLDRVRIAAGALTLRAHGTGPGDSSPLAFIAGDRSYEVTIDLELVGAAQGGLLLFYNGAMFAGLGSDAIGLHTYKVGREQGYPPPGPAEGRRVAMRIVNDRNVASFFIRSGRKPWRKVVSYEVSGYNHNIADGFMSLRPALFASGSGEVRFTGLTYRARA
nr:family 43 glycosylhydrolase [Sphingomonas montana]